MTTILHVIQQLTLGGAARALIASAKYSTRLGGYRHRVLSLHPAQPEAIALAREGGLEIVAAPDPKTIRRELAGADVVQVHWWNSPELQLLLHADLPPMRLLLWYHVCGEAAPQVITPELVRFADLNVPTNPWTARELPAFRDLPEAERAERVAMIVDPADFARVEGAGRCRERGTGLRSPAGFNVGYIGTLDFVKLHRRFVPMSAAVRVPAARFIVCGGGPVETLREEARRAGAAERFDFRGYVHDLRPVIETFDVYGYPLCPDTYASGELNLQEVMFAGVPPVVFPHGGVRGLVEHERTGLVVRTEEEYRAALEHLYHHPEERRRLGDAARKFARAHFGAENAARALNPLYDRLMQQPKRPRVWGCRAGSPASEQAVGVLDLLDLPPQSNGARLFVESLGDAAADFITSLVSGDMDAVLAAEERIASRAAGSPLMCSPCAGGVRHYAQVFPRDGWLRLWSGLVLQGAGEPAGAVREFSAAIELGCTHWRVGWHIAQTAARAGDHELAVQAARAVLEAEPNFAPARELIAPTANAQSPPSTVQRPTPSPQPPTLNPPLVTTIVSAYNSERFLRGCLEDLEAQTIADRLEIVVVDSASPQNERAIVEEFQQRYGNIVYIRTEERETIYGAWNRAIRVARGRYLTNANTDDRHRRDALEVLARTLEEHPEVALVYADCHVTRTENETFATARPVRTFRWLDFDRRALLEQGCFVGPQPMWRRAVHEELGGFDAGMVSAGDYEFWLRLAVKHDFLHVRETLGLYLESPGSVEHANRERALRETREARARHRRAILDACAQREVASGSRSEASPANSSLQAAGAEPSATTVQETARVTAAAPVAAVGDLGGARALLAGRQFVAAWDAAAAAVRARPFHPEGFLLLAEIARAAGDLARARACAEHARQLAPRWKAAVQFVKSLPAAKGGTAAALPELRLPAPDRPRLSVCLIVRNEERFLPQCLASVRGVADQIVVVDTGSTDRTVALAREAGAEVHEFAWCDDFSAARNAALARATGDWVLVLDADEELPAAQHEVLRRELRVAGVMGYRLPIVDAGREAEGCNHVPRLFRNAPGLHFAGRIHEQVSASLEARCAAWGLEHRLGRTTLLHHGYDAAVTRDRNKVERNLRLLRLALAEAPADANLRMNLGLELTRSGDLEAGLSEYQAAFDQLAARPAERVSPELREALLTQFTTHLLRAGRFADVARVLGSPLAKAGGLTASQHYVAGMALMEERKFAEAAEQFRQCVAKRGKPALTPIHADIRGAAPNHCLALCLAQLKQDDAAEQALQAALKDEPHSSKVLLDLARFRARAGKAVEALTVLHQAVGQDAGNAVLWALGGQIALSRAEFLEFALDWTGEAVKACPDDPAVMRQRAEALLLGQDAAAALPLWRAQAADGKPDALAAAALCAVIHGEELAVPVEQEPAVSRAFMQWYRRLLSVNARGVLEAINGRLSDLEAMLPGAAKVLQAALREAELTPA
jgi:glycosyltransferase involved in cell wall biosynthesis/predicted Zn-dependent protease